MITVNPMTPFEIITILVSIAALIISATSFLKSRNVSERLQDIEMAREKDRIIDRGSASLSVRGVLAEKTQFYMGEPRIVVKEFLEISNSGAAEAIIQRIELDGVSYRDHPTYLRKATPEIDRVAPNSQVTIRLSSDHQTAKPKVVRIIYDDGTGTNLQYQNPLTFV